MPLTISNTTGDAIASDRIVCAIEFPDSGSSINLTGTVQKAGAAAPIPITGSPLTAPADPASGTLVYVVQVDKGSGAATIKSQATTAPVPDTGSDGTPMEVVCTQTLQTTTADLSLDPAVTPDTA